MKEEQKFYIAMCKCCLIAEAMKNCPACRFKIGLLEQLIPVEPAPQPIMILLDPYEMAV